MTRIEEHWHQLARFVEPHGVRRAEGEESSIERAIDLVHGKRAIATFSRNQSVGQCSRDSIGTRSKLIGASYFTVVSQFNNCLDVLHTIPQNDKMS